MQRLHRIHFDVLRQQHGATQVTFHLPAGDRRQEKLRHLWSEADSQMTRPESEAVLAPLRYLVEDLPFWETSALNLSIFIRENQHFVLGSRYEAPPRAVVGQQFYLAPLLPILQEDFHFYVLELLPGGCRLHTGDLYHLRELSHPELPAKLAHALTREPYANRELDACLANFARGALVVVAGPQLVRQAIVTPSVRRLDVDDSQGCPSLHAQAWNRLRQHGDDLRRKALSQATCQLTRPEEISSACAQGAVETLAVAAGAEHWGIWDRGRWKPTEGPVRGSEELINSIALQVAGQGGTVFVAPAQELAPATTVVAGLRAGAQSAPLLRAG